MIEVNIVKIVIDVLTVFPLLMAIVLYIDYNTDGKYDIEFKITEFEDLKIRNDKVMNFIIKFIKKINEVVSKNE